MNFVSSGVLRKQLNSFGISGFRDVGRVTLHSFQHCVLIALAAVQVPTDASGQVNLGKCMHAKGAPTYSP